MEGPFICSVIRSSGLSKEPSSVGDIHTLLRKPIGIEGTRREREHNRINHLQ